MTNFLNYISAINEAKEEKIPSKYLSLVTMEYKDFKNVFDKSNKVTVGARELALYIPNKESVYNQSQLVVKNLLKKVKKGQYDHKLAVVAFKNVANSGSKAYKNDFGYEFSPDERWMAAVSLTFDFELENDILNEEINEEEQRPSNISEIRKMLHKIGINIEDIEKRVSRLIDFRIGLHEYINLDFARIADAMNVQEERLKASTNDDIDKAREMLGDDILERSNNILKEIKELQLIYSKLY